MTDTSVKYPYVNRAATMAMLEGLDLVSVSDIATRFGVKRATVHMWRTRSQDTYVGPGKVTPPFPEPDHSFSVETTSWAFPVWCWATVDAWNQGHTAARQVIVS